MYDELLLLCARPDSGICGTRHSTMPWCGASADRNRRSVRWLLHMSHGLIVCGLTLCSLPANLEQYDPVSQTPGRLTPPVGQASTELVVMDLLAAATSAGSLWADRPHRAPDCGAYASVKPSIPTSQEVGRRGWCSSARLSTMGHCCRRYCRVGRSSGRTALLNTRGRRAHAMVLRTSSSGRPKAGTV